MFPEMFRKMLKQGVKIVYCPSYWCSGDTKLNIASSKDTEINQVNAICSARSFENEMIVAYCNAAGKLEFKNIKDELIGNSQVCVPIKGNIKRLNHNKEELLLCEVDTKILERAESIYKIRKYAKKSV